jgi:predicted DNA-binding mobile mystery protein A
MPQEGWIRTVRKTLGMSLLQLGRKLNISKQSVSELERREAEGTIQLQKLREVAQAMNLHLVYALVPNNGSLESLVRERARAWAFNVVQRTHQTMVLEEQSTGYERQQADVEALVEELMKVMPKQLWD